MKNEIVFPPAFLERMQAQLGSEWNNFVEAHQKNSPTSIRINPKKNFKIANDGNVAWSLFGKYLDERPVFTLDPLFHAGTYYVQEASSMFLEQAFKQCVDLDQSLRVLDLSAAPGGKSTHILSLLNETSLLVSNEVIRSRASILSENIQKWGSASTLVTSNDPRDFEKLDGFFDVIVVDAPCSGEGLFRKDHDAMKEWSPENVALCASRQQRILNDVWPALKENGILIYCTCTYNESENENNLAWLKNEHAVEFLKIKTEKDWGVEEISKDEITGYRFFPHRVKGEGFFLSAMRKKEPTDNSRLKIKRGLNTPTKKQIETLNNWITNSDQQQFFQHNDLIFSVPESNAEAIQFLVQFLKVVYIGTNMATVKHEKLIPEHALALSQHLNQDHFNKIDVTLEDAIKYLRKDVLAVNGNEIGYSLITFGNIPLGWANVLHNRMNNMYPSEWRIRMAG
jgi:16S rRNA C967 or C1407 C5-methylase (RsmB/RsmF family)/NOL1/NOP2/fmu family ribosome biogenesis protein